MKLEQHTKEVEVKVIEKIPEITLTMNLEEAAVLFGILSTTTHSSVAESVASNSWYCSVTPSYKTISRFPYELWSSFSKMKNLGKRS